MINKPAISVVVPVYNVEKFLCSCIDSILAQTFTDFEVLLIDDGSKDRSGSICDEYTKKDSRIKVFHQTNLGVVAARKNGVKISNGEWITFVDSDDLLPTNTLQQYIDVVKNNKADIVIGYNDLHIHTGNKFKSIEEYRHSVLLRQNVEIAPWAKLIRKEIITDWAFDLPREIRIGEDWIMNIRLSFLTDIPPIILPMCTYIYRRNETGATLTNKMSPEYEHRFFQLIEQSIPFDEYSIYSNDLIRIGIYNVVKLSKQDSLDVTILDSDYFHKIKRLLKHSTIHLSFKEWMLFNCRIGILRWFTVKASNFINRYI